MVPGGLAWDSPTWGFKSSLSFSHPLGSSEEYAPKPATLQLVPEDRASTAPRILQCQVLGTGGRSCCCPLPVPCWDREGEVPPPPPPGAPPWVVFEL